MTLYSVLIRATNDPDKVKLFVFDFEPSKETIEKALDECELVFGKNLTGYSFSGTLIKRSDTDEPPEIKFFDGFNKFNRS
jgi:hypothetical protein